MPVLTLLTDFGLDDYYVAAVKGTLLRLAPGTTLVDISHGVPPGDVETGAFLLGAATKTFPAGSVHLAVVDPGVGSNRRMLAAEASGSYYVGPDNGLLTAVLEGGEVRQIDRPDLYLPSGGQTFHGRDRFAPAAAYLLRGEPLDRLGPPVDDAVRLSLPEASRNGGEVLGRIAQIDRFGNLVTNIPSGWLEGGYAAAKIGSNTVTVRATHYDELEEGLPGILPGSLGTLELSLKGESLARRWRIRKGEPVRLVVARRAPEPAR